MNHIAIIEIPRGCDRRIHLSIEDRRFVDFGPIKELIPLDNGVMPFHYGLVEDTLNPKEGDEVDVVVLSEKNLKTGDKIL